MTSNNYHFLVDNKMGCKGSVDSGFQEPIDIPHSTPLTSPVIDMPAMHTVTGLYSTDPRLQQQIASLKHQQQMQQQMLLEQFQEQQRQLAQQHEKQLEHMVHMVSTQEYLEQQKKLEQQQRLEREMLEKERLAQLKNKKKNEESAVASSEVKRRLQEFVLTKNQREQVTSLTNSPPHFSHWGVGQSSVDGSPSPQSGLSPPYGAALLGKYDDDFPLRKTASEPNILKVRSALKQKVMERRITQSPMLRRRENLKGPLPSKRKTLSSDPQVCHSNPDSGPNSPPNGAHGTLPNGSSASLHSKELFKAGLGYPCPELSLYTSPSMPNISLGRPPTSGSSVSSTTSSSGASDAEVRAIGAARFGLPLTAHMLPATLPYYPAIQVLNGEYNPQTSPAFVSAQMKALEEARQAGKLSASTVVGPYSIPITGITDSQAAHARLHRHRPLGRTQSAPLPLGHPLLQSPGLLIQQQQQQQQQQKQQQEQIMKEHQKMFLKQQIRQTVLHRTSSKSHMENVDEETEAKLAQEMKETREQESSEAVSGKEDKMDDDQSSDLEKQQQDREAFLVQQREILKMKHKGSHHHRPLSRTQSSPLVMFSTPQQQSQESSPVRYTFTTGLAYDSIMQKHQCTCTNNTNHPEHAGRLQSIWARLQETGLVDRCERVKSRKATLEELQSCHGEAYSLLYGTNPLNRQKLDPKLLEGLPMRFCLLPCGGVGVDSDTVWNDFHTSNAARMAAGCVIELSMRVATGELKNGLALVRPPGHHAEAQQAMGFCYFNSIAIAAKQLKLKKVLIVDWDVHHGNATQQMFYDDPNVLYISIHRHDNGNFFPGTGAPEECGESDGQGFNVNIAFGGNLNPPMGDGDYLAAFRTVVMPISREFNPDIVLVSAGFDAATGHDAPLGGYLISSACFGHMTRELMSLADGKIVLALEGGYDLRSICDASELCTMALLGDDLPPIKQEELCRPPCKAAIETLDEVIRIQAPHWPCVKRYAGTIQYSLLEAQKREMEEADTVTALASLSMVTAKGSMSPESEPMEEES